MKRGKPVHYRDYRSLGGKIVVALVMMAVIPYLLLIYLFFNNQIDFTETFIFFSPPYFDIHSGGLFIASPLCRSVVFSQPGDRRPGIRGKKRSDTDSRRPGVK